MQVINSKGVPQTFTPSADKPRVSAEATVSMDKSGRVVFQLGDKDDQVSIERATNGKYNVTVNGEKYQLSKAELKDAVFKGGAGDDSFKIAANVDVRIFIDGQKGDDKITAHNGDVAKLDHFIGGKGNNSYDIYASTFDRLPDGRTKISKTRIHAED